MLQAGFLVVAYNKDVICVLDKGRSLVCKTVTRRSDRRNAGLKNNLPSHDPYIPRPKTIFYDCSAPECKGIKLNSITQVTSPDLILKSCFNEMPDTYECETIRYNYFKNIDKVLFLSTNIPDKTFYLVDCLVYSDGGRVCHRKDGAESYPKLVDTGTMARPKEASVLSQDEFICEESKNKEVHCDLDPFTPFDDGLKVKEKVKLVDDILLKTGPYVIILKRNCIGEWCGFSGNVTPTRRSVDTRYPYDPPGGWVYRCYYAKNQQVCKPLYSTYKEATEQRNWLN